MLQNQAVDYLIQRVELDREAKNLGITVTDAEVARRLDEFKQEFFEGDEEKYKKEIGQIGLTEEDLLADIRAQLISEKIFDEVTKGISVPESAAQAYYDDNEDRFKVPESREVAHILVETKKEAQDIYTQLQDGASFEELAKEHSTDEASAENGGKLTDQKGTFVPEFEEVAFALDTGEIGEPVKSQFRARDQGSRGHGEGLRHAVCRREGGDRGRAAADAARRGDGLVARRRSPQVRTAGGLRNRLRATASATA